jgi:hypothetical protein
MFRSLIIYFNFSENNVTYPKLQGWFPLSCLWQTYTELCTTKFRVFCDVLPYSQIDVFRDILPCCQIDVNIDLTIRQYIPEDFKLHTRRRENLKSHLYNHFCRFGERGNMAMRLLLTVIWFMERFVSIYIVFRWLYFCTLGRLLW